MTSVKPWFDHYSRSLRRHLLGAVAVLLLLIVFDQELFTLYIYIGIPAVLLLTFFASISEPYSKTIITVDRLISVLFFLAFEYFAIKQYKDTGTILSLVFMLRQIIAAIFLGSFYISIREVRDQAIHKEYVEEHQFDT